MVSVEDAARVSPAPGWNPHPAEKPSPRWRLATPRPKLASAKADRSLRVRRLPAGEHRDEALNPLGARLWACGLVDAQ